MRVWLLETTIWIKTVTEFLVKAFAQVDEGYKFGTMTRHNSHRLNTDSTRKGATVR